MNDSIPNHWPEYAIEGLLLGLFMLAACGASAVVQHPASAVRRRVRSATARRFLIGLAMGLTAVALISSPLGQRSGAHMNPATTLSFFLLGKIGVWDALCYAAAQFAGGAAGSAVARALMPRVVGHPSVDHVVTQPGSMGRRGELAAFGAEALMTFVLFLTVLIASNNRSLAPFTGLLAGSLVCLYITIEAPISGMSLNPARTLASALAARSWRSIWIYFTAPPLGMAAAALVYVGAFGGSRVYCAKLDHPSEGRCIFNCQIDELRAGR